MLSRCKSGKPRYPGLGFWYSVQPIRQPNQVHCNGAGNVLQMGLGQANISTSPQFKGVYSLRNRAFYAGPFLILLFECLTALLGPSCMECFKFWLRFHQQGADPPFTFCTLFSLNTSRTVSPFKFYLYLFLVHPPAFTDLSCGADKGA